MWPDYTPDEDPDDATAALLDAPPPDAFDDDADWFDWFRQEVAW